MRRTADILVAIDQQGPNYDKQRAQADRLDDAEQIADTGETPHAAVNIEEVEAQEFDQNGDRQNGEHLIDKLLRNIQIEPHQVSGNPGEAQQEYVDSQNDEKVAVEERLSSPQIEEFRYHY